LALVRAHAEGLGDRAQRREHEVYRAMGGEVTRLSWRECQKAAPNL
jgi:hypothetical protein